MKDVDVFNLNYQDTCLVVILIVHVVLTLLDFPIWAARATSLKRFLQQRSTLKAIGFRLMAQLAMIFATFLRHEILNSTPTDQDTKTPNIRISESERTPEPLRLDFTTCVTFFYVIPAVIKMILKCSMRLDACCQVCYVSCCGICLFGNSYMLFVCEIPVCRTTNYFWISFWLLLCTVLSAVDVRDAVCAFEKYDPQTTLSTSERINLQDMTECNPKRRIHYALKQIRGLKKFALWFKRRSAESSHCVPSDGASNEDMKDGSAYPFVIDTGETDDENIDMQYKVYLGENVDGEPLYTSTSSINLLEEHGEHCSRENNRHRHEGGTVEANVGNIGEGAYVENINSPNCVIPANASSETNNRRTDKVTVPLPKPKRGIHYVLKQIRGLKTFVLWFKRRSDESLHCLPSDGASDYITFHFSATKSRWGVTPQTKTILAKDMTDDFAYPFEIDYGETDDEKIDMQYKVYLREKVDGEPFYTSTFSINLLEKNGEHCCHENDRHRHGGGTVEANAVKIGEGSNVETIIFSNCAISIDASSETNS